MSKNMLFNYRLNFFITSFLEKSSLLDHGDKLITLQSLIDFSKSLVSPQLCYNNTFLLLNSLHAN